jgi:hypothetical protein
MYYCDTQWHDFEIVDAEFLILSADEVRPVINPSFACCRSHLTRSMVIMLDHNKEVRVRRVSNERHEHFHRTEGKIEHPERM